MRHFLLPTYNSVLRSFHQQSKRFCFFLQDLVTHHHVTLNGNGEGMHSYVITNQTAPTQFHLIVYIRKKKQKTSCN